MRNLVNRTSVIVVGIVLLGALVANAEDQAKDGNIIKNGKFEEWEWRPLDFRIKKRLAQKKENEECFNIEVKGLRTRFLKGMENCPSGTMVEGENAYEGKSLFLENNSKKDSCDIIGLDGFFRNLIEPDKKYEWEVYIKGKGPFQFRPWVEGADKESGKTKWLAYPLLIKIVPGDQWKKYSGTFIIDSNKYSNYLLAKKISCAILVPAGTAIYVDNFSIREVKDSSPETSEKEKSAESK